MSVIRLPACLTTEQFAFLTQMHVQVVRRKIRNRTLKGMGNPIRIPPRELLKYGIDLDYAAMLLHERSQPRSPGQS